MKKIPYGKTDFEKIMADGMYYVDKTQYIERLEAAHDYFFFLRPRRFGKTLLIQMLKSYYDINLAERFDDLFGNLYIGKHPTAWHNKYAVLSFDFSTISEINESCKSHLDQHSKMQAKKFGRYYAERLPENFLSEIDKICHATGILEYIYTTCRLVHLPLYVFIDEYDHFTNNILASPQTLDQYESETHGEDYLRSFFTALKAGTSESIERMFITGVSPVTMDDLTPGFNIGTDYSTKRDFNAMVGFDEGEVRQMLDYYREASGIFNHTTDQLVEIIKPWYNNYCFSTQAVNAPKVFNSDMVLHFLSEYIEGGGRCPANLIDKNIRTDYAKLDMLARYNSKSYGEISTIEELSQRGCITGEVKNSFRARDIAKPDNYISMLYYLGLLTITGVSNHDTTTLGIPNQCVKEQMFGYLLDNYKQRDLTYEESDRCRLLEAMAYNGDFKAFFKFQEDVLRRFSTHRDKQHGEPSVQAFIKGQICLNRYWLALTEEDMGVGAGFTDLYFMPRKESNPNMLYSYVIEFKYAKARAPQSEIDQKISEATAAVRRYAAAPKVQATLAGTKLKTCVVLFKGYRLAYCEEV